MVVHKRESKLPLWNALITDQRFQPSGSFLTANPYGSLCYTPAMKPKTMYLLLCFAGFLLPYSEFLPWVFRNGLNPVLFWQQLFASQISAFFVMDVVVSAVALIVFMRIENRHLPVRGRWLPVVAVLTVGVSLALPLFLYLRELKLEQDRPGNP